MEHIRIKIPKDKCRCPNGVDNKAVKVFENVLAVCVQRQLRREVRLITYIVKL